MCWAFYCQCQLKCTGLPLRRLMKCLLTHAFCNTSFHESFHRTRSNMAYRFTHLIGSTLNHSCTVVRYRETNAWYVTPKHILALTLSRVFTPSIKTNGANKKSRGEFCLIVHVYIRKSRIPNLCSYVWYSLLVFTQNDCNGPLELFVT